MHIVFSICSIAIHAASGDWMSDCYLSLKLWKVIWWTCQMYRTRSQISRSLCRM